MKKFILLFSLVFSMILISGCSSAPIQPKSQQSDLLDKVENVVVTSEKLIGSSRALNPSIPRHKAMLAQIGSSKRTSVMSGKSLLDIIDSKSEMSTQQERNRSKLLRMRLRKIEATRV